MSTSLEAKVDDLLVSLMAPIAAAANLQLVRKIADATLEPNRIAVATTDQGEERSVKWLGNWGRKLQSRITLKISEGDAAAETTETLAGRIFAAIQASAVAPLLLAPFQMLVIREIGESDLTFDKLNWVKVFVITFTAIAN